MSERKQDLEGFIDEAVSVEELSRTRGWAVIMRDLKEYIKAANRAWAKMDPSNPKFQDLRINTLACSKLIDVIHDYRNNRFQAEIEWLKEEFPELYVRADVDNETALREED